MEDLFWKVQELCELNEERVKALRSSGVQLAENEAEYRKALRIEILKERAKGTPVTIIGDLVRGLPHISELRLKRDTAEAVYWSIREEVNVNQLRIRVLDNQLGREWGQAGQGGY